MQIAIPAWFAGPLIALTGPFAVFIILGFGFGYLVIRDV